jgi:putative hydrolase of the HAD superfamily
MAPTAVVFDLFGTLIAPYRYREHQACVAAAALILGADAASCTEHWRDTWERRARGAFPTIAENLRVMAPDATEAQLRDAAAIYTEFTLDSLRPKAGAIELLERLRARGLRLALLTNCSPDVPLVWSETPFAGRFDVCVFSSEIGWMKPQREAYEAALGALGTQPGDTWFVGDGSDNELSAARAVGLTAVLVDNDLSNTYDADRPDVVSWDGPRLTDLLDLTSLVDAG